MTCDIVLQKNSGMHKGDISRTTRLDLLFLELLFINFILHDQIFVSMKDFGYFLLKKKEALGNIGQYTDD